jgi:hypothetical protein
MKTFTYLLTASALCAAVSPASAFLAFDDNAELFVTGTAEVRRDNNIFLSPTDQDDTVFEFKPGLDLVFGNASVLQGSLSLSESFTTYADHDDLNDELLSTSFNSRYDDGKSKVSLNASFNELNQNTVDTLPIVGTRDGLIRRDVLNLGGTGEISITEKSSVSAGVQYNRADFKRSGFSDSQSVALPVNYYYEMTAKLDLSLGYRFRQKWEGIGQDTKDHFFNIGARGEFTPKLSGNIAVGLTQRDFETRDDASLFGIDSSLSYAVSPKTSLQFGVSNDFDTNSQGQQQKNFSVRISGRSKISEQWSITTAVSYRKIDYYTRVDDYYEGQVGVTYTASRNLDVSAGLALRSNKSDLPTSEFDNNVLSLAAHLRF